MPKELTHFTIAEQIFQSMEPSWLKKLVQKHLDLYFIGAVTHDTPYYLRGKWRPHFQALAACLHGTNGEDTYLNLKNLFNIYGPEMPDYVLSFACGLFTHIFIDSEFHPLVYYLTGDYNARDPVLRMQAVCRHRQWEAGLDMHFTDRLKTCRTSRLKNHIAGKKISESEFYKLLQVFYFGENKWGRQIKLAVDSQVKMLLQLDRPGVYRMLSLVNSLTLGRLNPTLSLFYHKDFNPADYEKTFAYIHPGDGQMCKETVWQIRQRSVQRCVDQFAKWQDCNSPGAVGELLAGQKGPSLENGIVFQTNSNQRLAAHDPD